MQRYAFRWSRYARLLQALAADSKNSRAINLSAQVLLAHLGNGNADGGLRILDVGSGTGRFTFPLLDRVSSGIRAEHPITVHALEPAIECRRRFVARLSNRRESVVVFPMSFQGYCGRVSNALKYDVVLMSHVLYYFDDWTSVWHAATRLLKPDGVVVVVLTSGKAPMYRLREQLARQLGYSCYLRQPFYAEDWLTTLESSRTANIVAECEFSGFLCVDADQDTLSLADLFGFLFHIEASHLIGMPRVLSSVRAFLRDNADGVALRLTDRLIVVPSSDGTS